MLEADLRLEQEAHLATRQLLARSTAELGRLRDSQALALVEAAKAAAKISAAERARDAALSRASDAEEAARFSASEAFEKLCADAYALGGSSDRDDDDRKVGQLCELLPRALKETRRSEDVDDLGVCVVCLTEPRNVALFDCGHIAVCSDCVESINNVCPLCRQQAFEYRRVFLS